MKSNAPSRFGNQFLAFGAALCASALMGNQAFAAQEIPAAVNYEALQYEEDFDRFIVNFPNPDKDGLVVAGKKTQLRRLAALTGKSISLVRTLGTGADLVQINNESLKRDDAEAFMATAAASGVLDAIEPDSRMYAYLSPNDTYYSLQWHYYESTAGMNLPLAWDVGSGSGVVVAVIDTGITPHPDLSANVVAGYDFVSSASAARDGNGRDSNPNDQGDWWANSECGPTAPPSQSSSWHGTHVAGTVAAVTSNAGGVAGVAFNARVQPLRVLAKCGGSLSDIADAIVWAAGGSVPGVPVNPTPAKVINMSLGGGGSCGTTYQNAINSAVSRGATVVVAAGNENRNASQSRPANCSNVVAVAALDRQGNRAYYSNYGSRVDVAAPGGEMNVRAADGVLSTLNNGTTTQGSPVYAYYQGTSMASPHVAGLVAMMLSRRSLTPAQVESYLKTYVRPIPGSCSGGCGAGLVDANRTMQAVR